MSEYKSLEEIKKETKKEQEKYEKYNQGFLSSWADRADIYKKVSSLVQPLFEKILDTIVDYYLEINKKEKSNTLMEKTIDKMVDVLNDYYDTIEETEEKEENNNYFYKDKDSNKDVGIEKDPKEFYLSKKSIDEINSGNVYVNLDNILVDKGKFNAEKIKNAMNIETNTYTINKDMNGCFMMICLNGYNKDSINTDNFNPESSTLILQGLSNNQIEIFEIRDSKNPSVIDFEDIINHIFIDSDIHIMPEEKPNDNEYINKIKSLEQLKEYFKSQGKDVSSLDESVKYNKERSDRFERWNKSKECKPTQKELSAIDVIKQAAEETEQIIKDNA